MKSMTQQKYGLDLPEDKIKFLEGRLSKNDLKKIEAVKSKSVSEFEPNDWESWNTLLDIRRLDILSKLPKDTRIYTILRHVSQSGMMRVIDMFYVENGDVIRVHFGTDKIFQKRHQNDSKDGYKVSGCGMDMGFHLVNSLSYLVSQYNGLEADGYYFKQEWV